MGEWIFIPKKKKRWREWAVQDADLVRELYPITDTRILAEVLDRSVSSVQKKAYKLGVKKNRVLEIQHRAGFI